MSSLVNAFLLLICCCTINSTIGQDQPNTIINLAGYACATSETNLSKLALNETGNAQINPEYFHPTFKPLPGMDATVAALTPCLSVQIFNVKVVYNPDELPPEAAMVWPDKQNSQKVPSCKSMFNEIVKLPTNTCQILEKEEVHCDPWTEPDYQQSKYSLSCNTKFHLKCKLPTVAIDNYNNIYFTYVNIRGYEDESKSNFPCPYIYETFPGYRLLIPKDFPNSMPIEECLDQLNSWKRPCPCPNRPPKTTTTITTTKPTSSTKTAPTTRRNTTTPAATTTTTVKVKTTSITNAATTITSGPTPNTTITSKTNSTTTKTNATTTKTNEERPKPEEHPCLFRWPFKVLIVVTSLLLILLIVLICLCLYRRCKKPRTSSKDKEALLQEHPKEAKGPNEPSLEGENEISLKNDEMGGDGGTGFKTYYDDVDGGVDVPNSFYVPAPMDPKQTPKGKGGNAAITQTDEEEYNELENLYTPKPKIKKVEATNEEEYANIEGIFSKDRLGMPEELYSEAEAE